MGDDGAFEPTAAAKDAPSHSALLEVRYREALHARFVADWIRSDAGSAERLEERVRRFEKAAASVEMPSLSYFLESARLIRAGDLIGAKSAFDSGIAPPVVDAAISPAAVDVAVLPARVDVATLLAGRYREALRARFVADRIGSDARSGARLEERVQRFEEAASSVEMPSLWYFLESARLIRAGDLIGAKSAFDSGIAPPVVGGAIAPVAIDPLTVDIQVLPRAVDLAVAPRAVPWDSLALAAYLVLLTIWELAVTFGSPLLVFPLHGGIVGLAALHVAWLEVHSDRDAGHHRLTPFLLTFIVVASIRIISLTLPLAAIEPAWRYLFAGVPMTLGALLVARAAGYSMRDVGLAWRMWRLQVIVIVVSMGLGFIEFAILRPAPMGPFPWVAAGLIPAVVVVIATGLPEELIFRGVLQTATRPILGRLNWIYASLVFAVLHIGYQSSLDLVFVFGVGLLYGWVFERSRSIIGVSIGHGLANVVLFFVAPNLPAVARWLGI